MRISFDSAAEIYDKTRGPPRQIMNQLVKTLISELSCYETILDIGVGTGRFTKPLQDNGFEVVGADIAKKMISKAVKKGAHNLLQGDACFLPFKDNSFEVALSVHLLHLISEWKMALQEICRVTRRVMVSMTYVGADLVWETYDCLLKGCGCESHRVGKGEWELESLVKPAKSVFVASYSRSADRRLTHMSQRAYSSQWQVPEDVNKEVVDELKRQFGGKAFRKELRILVWDINDLEAYCSSSISNGFHSRVV
ncbi:MAG: class I SAM-dependent methyltransferase [Candidatus Bathyarchaeota archaeon]|nr:class I SAM-dependent methyltransferase [Candidatus Bathyarchaeota archaeon]MDH5494723.1 class I SAM-dependent methyltransferase [Candidatus Bathyarchaeota archaeon]